MRILITCGPSYEPIDDVRRITNFSTGRLGIYLANYFYDEGHEIICYMGVGRSCQDPLKPRMIEFTTTENLGDQLKEVPHPEKVDVVLHAAALSDYKVRQVCDSSGAPLSLSKIPSSHAMLRLELVSAPKLLPRLKKIFPKATIVGWKYELVGTPQDALQRALRQMATCKTDACVLNGKAAGDGFTFCVPSSNTTTKLSDLPKLAVHLSHWLKTTRET